MKPRLFAIDGAAYIFRSYFALQPRWYSVGGYATQAVYGFASFLLKLLERERPEALAVAFDESLGSGFRHRLSPAYKANRALPDEALAFQLEACRRLTRELGIATFASEEFEADDILATLAKTHGKTHEIIVVSPDKDLAQVLAPGVTIRDYGRKEPIDETAFRETHGFAPVLMPDYLALVGDPGDNIPGVPGIGARTAAAILGAFGALENWLDEPDRLAQLAVRGSRRLPERVAPLREQIRLARRLARLESAIEEVRASPCPRWAGFDPSSAGQLLEELGLQGLMPRVEAVAGAELAR